MLANIRAFAKSPAAALLIVLLIASFAVFGIRDVFNGRTGGNAVITAGSRSLSPADFKREFDSYKARVEQQVGQPIPMEAVAANGLDKRAAEGLAGREAFAEHLSNIGLKASDKLIAAEIHKIPAFFDQVTGKFDKKAYETRLSENRLTPARFESVMGDEVAQQQMATGLAAGLRAPRAYTALAAIFGLENRDLRYFAVEASSVPRPATPTDAQLTAFLKENAAQLTRPETRVLTVVRFSPAQVGANLPVDPAELKKRYDFKKDTLSSPETRTIVQIPAKSPAAVQQIGSALSQGADPKAVAKAAGVDAITYANKPQSAIADRKLGAAAFAMKPGQISAVQGDLGVAVVKVVSIAPGHPVTFEDVRPQLEAEIRKDAAQQKTYDLTQVYDDAHQAGSNLAQAAQKAGVPAMTVGPLSAEGRDAHGQPVAGVSPKIAATAFSLPAGGESEVEDEGNGEYYAVRVEKIIPPALASLEEVRPQLTQVFMARELVKALQAKADAFAARLKKGESLEAVAASAGSPVMQLAHLDRQSAGQNTQVSQDFLAKAFGVKVGETFVAENTHPGLVVAKLEAVRPGDVSTQALISERMRPQMTEAVFREMIETAQAAARRKVKVVIDGARARAAIGLEPDAAAPNAKSKAPAKPGLAK